jgi:hypothetical protein
MNNILKNNNIWFILLNILISTIFFIASFKINNLDIVMDFYFSIYIISILILGILKWKKNKMISNKITIFLILNGITAYTIYIKYVSGLNELNIRHILNLCVVLIFISILFKMHFELGKNNNVA